MSTDRRPVLSTFGAIDAFFGGIGFVIARPRIWPWALIPAFMLVVLFAGSFVLAVWGGVRLDREIFGIDRGTWGGIGYWILMVIFILFAVLLAILTAMALTEPLSAFALERISQSQTLALQGTHPRAPNLFRSMILSLCSVALALVLGITAFALLMVVNFFYPPAMIVTVPLKALVCAWMLAWDLIDYPMGVRGIGIFKRLGWIFRHFGAFTLFGLMWAGCAVVPGVILVLLPMGVAGATQMVLKDDPRQPNDGE